MTSSCVNKSFFACSFILVLAFAAAQIAYQEPYRPQVHFSPREHWANDPNGLVFFHGQYHLFFQFNPMGSEWGHMSWGHAISTDLLHWNELPVTIPEKDGEMVFTGSVVIDGKNTSGFCAPGKECLVAIYTGHRQSPLRQPRTLLIASMMGGRGDGTVAIPCSICTWLTITG